MNYEPHPIVTWELTRECDLACRGCPLPRDARSGTNELSTYESYKTIDQILELAPREFFITGGDPLEREDVYQIVDYSRRRGLLPVLVVDGDRVVVRGTDRGTHRGEFMGFPASGREVTTTWIEIFRMENGKAAEGWLESDSARLRNQLVAEPGEGLEDEGIDDETTLHVRDPRAIREMPVDAKRPLRDGALREHGVARDLARHRIETPGEC